MGLGLDAPTWAKEGLVDLVVATPRWATMHFDIPLADADERELAKAFEAGARTAALALEAIRRVFERLG